MLQQLSVETKIISTYHHHTGYAGWCYRQHNLHHSVSKLVGGPANSGVLLWMLIELRGAWLWPSWSLFLAVWSGTCTPVTCWRSSCRNLAVLLDALSKTLSSSPYVTMGRLVSPQSSWDCAWRHSQPCACTYGCTILEKLDHLFNLIGLQVQPNATSSEKDTGRTQNKRRIGQEGQGESSFRWKQPHAKPFPFLGSVLLLPVHWRQAVTMAKLHAMIHKRSTSAHINCIRLELGSDVKKLNSCQARVRLGAQAWNSKGVLFFCFLTSYFILFHSLHDFLPKRIKKL